MTSSLMSTFLIIFFDDKFSVIRSAKRVFLEITFTISKCDSCRESFTIYNYQAQSDIANPDYPPWDESRYKKIDVVAAHNQYDQNRPGSLNAMETKILPIDNVTRYIIKCTLKKIDRKLV